MAIDRTDGLRGLELLDKLDLEAVFLYEKHPTEFRRLATSSGVMRPRISCSTGASISA